MTIENNEWTRVRKVKTVNADESVTVSYELTVECEVVDAATSRRATSVRIVALPLADFSASAIAALDTAAAR